jgi:hypothetical protein
VGRGRATYLQESCKNPGGSVDEVRSKVTERSGRRRAIAAMTGVLSAGLILSTGAVDVSARPVVLQQADVVIDAAASPVGDGLGSNPTVSGDGRFVVFQGLPGLANDEPAAADSAEDSRKTTIYLTDRESGITSEVAIVPPGLRPGNSVNPVISGDGCTVVTVTEMALDVFQDDDTGDRWDVYRSRLPHCDAVNGWELVSTRTDGSALARDDARSDEPPAVSRNGTVIAYSHPATQLLDNQEVSTITVVDLALPVGSAERSVVVAGMPISAPDTQFVHEGLGQPALSDYGRFVAFRSDASSTDAVAGWGTGVTPGGLATSQVYVWDREQPDPFLAVRLVSARPDGSPTTAGASEPSLSRDGRFIAFTSADAGLVPAVFPVCSDGCPTQIYRLDRDIDENGWLDEANRTSMTLVSGETGSEPLIAGSAPSSQPSLSADGQLIAFVSKAPNLQLIKASGGGERTDGDLLVADTHLGTLRRVALTADGVHPAVAAHSHPQISDTGRTTVFDTLAAAQLLPGEVQAGRQVVAMSVEPTLSLADADLGTTLVGLESDEWYVAVINNGPTSFTPSLVTVSDGHFDVNLDASTCSLGASVPPGGDCTVRLSFTPSSAQSFSATLTVAEEGFQAVSVSSLLTGAGGEPTLRSDPAGADLGFVDVGQSGPEFQFDVQNISLVPSSVADVRVTGAHASDFAVTSNSCPGHPLNPRATCSVGITFTPTDAGRRTALIEIVTPSGQYTTMVASGDAQYAPELVLIVDEIEAGREFLAGGSGYPPNTTISVVFGDGAGETVTTTTNAEGGFFMIVPVASNERGGVRTIVVQTPDGTVASTPVDVIEQPNNMIGLPGFGLGG